MVSLIQHDVLISGAGPAGAHLAIRLAKAGWSVGLIDRKIFPRAKLCGEFLSPECMPLLDEVGLKSSVLAAGARHVGGMRLYGFGRFASGAYKQIGKVKPPKELGLAIRRERLDQLAFEQAQQCQRVETYLGYDVSEVILDETGRAQGLLLRDPCGKRIEMRARFIVGADGAKSRVARSLGWHRTNDKNERWAIVARFTGVEEKADAEVHFLEGAYFAACAIDGGEFTANLVLNASALPKGARNLRETFEEHVSRAPELAARLKNAQFVGEVRVCGPLATNATQCTGPGAALVGDACGFVDPLTGEGIFIAMRGASLLADSLMEALAHPEREAQALARYERQRRKAFGSRYKLARLLQRGIRHPALISGVLSVLAGSPGLCDLLVGLTGDYVPHSALLKPMVWMQALRRRRKIAGAT